MVSFDAANVASGASLLVSVLAAAMAVLGYRSYRRTGNPRLVFIVLAFALFVFKGLFAAYNVTTHAVPHDSIELVLAMFDVVIVLTLFIPFFLVRPAQ